MSADWRAIKTEYVTGAESYRAVAARHGLSVSTLSKVAKKENWQKQRRQYGDKVATQTEKAMCARASAREVKKLCGLQQAADRLTERINALFSDAEQFNRHIVTRSDGGGGSFAEERVFLKADTKAIRDLTASLKDLTAVVRNLYNLPTAQERTAMDIALERLRLDQAKAVAGEVDEKETGVVALAALTEVMAEPGRGENGDG